MWKMSFERNDDGSLRDADFTHEFIIKGAFLTLDELREILWGVQHSDYYVSTEDDIKKLLRQKEVS